MSPSETAARTIELNADGYLKDPSDWTPAVAEALARESGIEALTPRHWQVLTFCREDAAREGTSPGLRRITQQTGVPTKELYQLFPKGPGKLAARIAGLHKPTSCL